jgi:hypothetical protein
MIMLDTHPSVRCRQVYRKVAIECFKKKKRTKKDGNDNDSKTLEEAWEAMKEEQVCHL